MHRNAGWFRFGMIGLLWLAGTAMLRAQNGSELRVEPGGHTDAVHVVLFNGPDTLMSGGLDKVVRVWDMKTGAQRRTLRYLMRPNIEEQVFSAALSPTEGGPLALGLNAVQNHRPESAHSRGDDRDQPASIRLLDRGTGTPLGQLPPADSPKLGHLGAVTGLAYTPDGKQLASCGSDGKALLWTLAQPGNPRAFRLGEDEYATAIGISPDAHWLAVSSWRPDDTEFIGAITVWDMKQEGRKPYRFTRPGKFLSLAWSKEYLACGTEDGQIYRYRPGQKSPLNPPFAGVRNSITCLAFTHDGGTLIAGGGAQGNDVRVHVFSMASGAELPSFNGHQTTVFAVTVSPDDRQVASADAYGAIHVWDLPTPAKPVSPEESILLKGDGNPGYNVVWSADSNRVAWADHFGQFTPDHVFSLTKAAPVPAEREEGWTGARIQSGPYQLVPLPDGRTVTLRQDGREVRAISVAPGDRVKCFGFVPSVGSYRQHERVLVGSEQSLDLYDVSGKPYRVRHLNGPEGPILSVAVSPDGRRLAATSVDQTVRIWNIESVERELDAAKTTPQRTPPEVDPMVSVFVGDDRKWVVWTPSGYFTASAGGEDFIGLQVAGKPGRPEEFRTGYQCYRDFYNPELIARTLESGSEALARALETGNRQPSPAPQFLSDQLDRVPAFEKLTVDGQAVVDGKPVTDPDAVLTSMQARVELRVRVSDPLCSIFLARNHLMYDGPGLPVSWRGHAIQFDERGHAIQFDERGHAIQFDERGHAIQFDERGHAIQFDERGHAIQFDERGHAIQFDERGHAIQFDERSHAIQFDERDYHPDGGWLPVTDNRDPRDVVRYDKNTGEWVLPVNLVSGMNEVRIIAGNDAGSSYRLVRVRYQEQKPTLHLLAIGISDYGTPTLDLIGAQADATDICTVFRQQQGTDLFSSVDPRLLVDHDASKEAIMTNLDDIAQVAREQDTVILFVACHGGTYVKDKIDGFCLLPYGVQLSEDNRVKLDSAIDWTDLLNRLSRITAQHIVLLVDHCFAGGISDLLLRASLQGSRQRNIIVFAASAANEPSLGREGHGVFTRELLSALEGEDPQAIDEDGKTIRLDLLETRVSRRVVQVESTWAQLDPSVSIQHPALFCLPNADRRIPLVVLPPQKRRRPGVNSH